LQLNPNPWQLHYDWTKNGGQVTRLHRQLAIAKSAAQKAILQRQIDATDAEIDRLVYDLYGLTAEEIALVENTTSESKAAPGRTI